MPAIQEKLQQAHSVTDKCAKLFESLAKVGYATDSCLVRA
jgi:hypothetical protein